MLKENAPHANSVSVDEAAKIMGKSASYIRKGLMQGTLPFGSYVKNKKNCDFHISREALENYMKGTLGNNVIVCLPEELVNLVYSMKVSLERLSKQRLGN